jgi:hypothetical protein
MTFSCIVSTLIYLQGVKITITIFGKFFSLTSWSNGKLFSFKGEFLIESAIYWINKNRNVYPRCPDTAEEKTSRLGLGRRSAGPEHTVIFFVDRHVTAGSVGMLGLLDMLHSTAEQMPAIVLQYLDGFFRSIKQEPILRLLNLQLQRQHFSRLRAVLKSSSSWELTSCQLDRSTPGAPTPPKRRCRDLDWDKEVPDLSTRWFFLWTAALPKDPREC